MAAIGKLPYAGVSFYVGHYLHGLRQLGYDVHYVERQNRSGEYYDPTADVMTDDLAYAHRYLRRVLPRFGVGPDAFSLIDLAGACHGQGWADLAQNLDRAEFVLAISNPTWFDELERCARRAFVDGDPVFTQASLVTGTGTRGSVLAHYDTLFTYGVRIGKTDCPVPTGGRSWIPTWPVVATDLWPVSPPRPGQPVTALLHWAAGADAVIDGRTYGHKDREFERLLELPGRATQRFLLAVGGGPPRKKLREHGWELTSPLEATRTLAAYRRFIASSRADLGVAKHAYVASRCGWFSDRSTCFLAGGRPVLHQDTGFGERLPTGEGVLPFSDLDDLVDALERLERDYDAHARRAREIAEGHFEAATVLARMLDEAGFR